MAKFLFQASYTIDGTRGLIKEGGSSRRAAIEQMVKGLGGKLESCYYAFGKTDVFLVAELPDATSAAAISLTVGASGGARVTTITLMTPEEVDVAAKKSVRYRAPGA
jgi:uncharacterized protein with GYD domain